MLTNLNKDGVEEPGIPYITEAYYKHRDNAEVVENICVLFMELCEYSESTSRSNVVSQFTNSSPWAWCALTSHCRASMLVSAEIKAEVRHMRIGETVLNEIHKRFKENKV